MTLSRISAFVLLGLCASAYAKPTPRMDRQSARILRQLGVSPTDPVKLRAHAPGGKLRGAPGGLAAQIETLKTQAFAPSPPAMSEAARRAGIFAGVPRKYGGATLSAPAHQARVHSLLWSLTSELRRSFRVDARAYGVGPSAVLEGAAATGVNASAWRTGAITVHRDLLDTADKIGLAIVGARSKNELMNAMWQIAADRFQAPQGLDTALARKHADGFVAMVLAHEITHGVRYHTTANDKPEREHAWEHIADHGAIHLATRANFSVLGQLSAPAFFAVKAAFDARRSAPHLAMQALIAPQADHPAPLERHARLHSLVSRIGSKAQKSALRDAPTPDELRDFLQLSLATGAQ